jgi:outer membrane immunogenic protein
MKCLLTGAFVLFAGIASAQEEKVPRAEIGLTYSFIHSTTSDSSQVTSNGGSGYFVYDWNRVLGLVADFGAYHNGTAHGLTDGQTTFSYLFGPRFNWRRSRLNPYVQFLVGGARLAGATSQNGVFVSSAQNGFATALGGGIDVSITRHIAIKPIQVEYLMTQIPSLASNRNGFQNDLRYSAGVVWKFGEK